MERAIGRPGPGTPVAATPGRLPQKPGVAFKHAMARAMEGWGPDAPATAARPRPGTAVAAARPAAAVQQARAPAAPPAPLPQARVPLPPAPVQQARAPAAPPAPRAEPAERPGAFRQLIARLETGPGRPDHGYGARNTGSGALGRYQMLPVALRDIGWQDATGQWTEAAARHGVRSEAEFLATPAAQEAAMSAYLRRAELQLERNGSLSRAGASIAGMDGAAVPLTDAGLVAAAHRAGAHSVARYLAHLGGGADSPLSAADRNTFAAVERRLRQFAELPYQVASRRTPPSA